MRNLKFGIIFITQTVIIDLAAVYNIITVTTYVFKSTTKSRAPFTCIDFERDYNPTAVYARPIRTVFPFGAQFA